MDNSNTLIIKRKIAGLQVDLVEKLKHLAYLDKLLKWSFVLTFLLYFAFALSLYVGDVFAIKSIVESFVGGSYALLFFGVIAFLLAYVLAATKHTAYIHFSMFKTVKIIVLLMVFTGILAEVFNSSGVQDSKSRSITENSTEYQNLAGTSSASSIKLDEGLTSRIAYAQKVVARCEENVRLKKEKHCKGDNAKLIALLDSQKVLMTAQLEASSTNQESRFNRMDELKDDSFNPVIKSLSKLLNIEITQAVSLLMLLFACLFEAMHYYLSIMREDTLFSIEGIKNCIERLEVDLINFANDYSQRVVNNQPSDFAEVNRRRWEQTGVVASSRQPFMGFVNPSESRVTPTAFHGGSAKPARANSPQSVGVSERLESEVTQDEYIAFKEAVIRGEVKVNLRSGKSWLRGRKVGDSERSRQAIVSNYYDQMHNEGLLILNPANTTGINKAKYVIK